MLQMTLLWHLGNIIGVTVVGGMTNNLTDPIVLNFAIPNKARTLQSCTEHYVSKYNFAQNPSDYVFVSWNFSAAGMKSNKL